MAEYIYSISADTASNAVNEGLLAQEIDDDVTIVTALDGVETDDDVLEIEFVSALSGAEQTALTAVVNAHGGAPDVDDPEASSTGQSVTSATTWQDKTTTGSVQLGAGDWLVSWYCEMYTEGGIDQGNMMQMLHGATVLGSNHILRHLVDDDTWRATSGFACVTVTSGLHEFKMQWKSQHTSWSAKIRRARIRLERC